jgi:glycosyltransferase involved in cell wall biosynthesis
MRVLHVVGYPHRMAGANRSLLELVSHYPDRVDARVLLTADSAVAAAYRQAGVAVDVLPVGPSLSLFGHALLRLSPAEKAWALARDLLPFWVRLGRFMREKRIELVHANDPRATILAGPVARALRRPLVVHLRGERSFDGVLWRAGEVLPQRIITVSRAIQTSLAPAARRRAVTVYNAATAVDLEGARVPWLEHLRRSGVTVVSVFATLVPFKGCHRLLEAIALLNRRGWRRRIAFVWVGEQREADAEYHRWLHERQQALAVDNLTFAGWQDDPVVFYRSTDVALCCSVSEDAIEMGGKTLAVRGHEGLPRALLDAMSCALPVVSTEVAGVPEIVVEGETGLMVPARDAEALAAAIERLASDRDLRLRLGRAGHARVYERFSTASCVEGVVNVFDELCGGRLAGASSRTL